MSEIPFLAEMQRLTWNPVAMRFRLGLVRSRPVRTRCGVQPQFVAQPSDLCGGDRSVERLQGGPHAAEHAASGETASRTVPPVMVRV